MLEKLLEIADKLWKKIAFLIPNKLFCLWNKKKSNNFVYYNIRPYKDNERWVGYWEWFLSNFLWIKWNITFFILGNKDYIKLYARVSKELEDYFENTFFASFPSCELVKLKKKDINFNLESSKYLYFDNPVFYSKQDFKKEGDYIDPLKDIFSVYYNIPSKSGEVITFFDYDFDNSETFFVKIKNWLKALFWWMFGPSKGSVQSSKEDEENEKEDTTQSVNLSIGFNFAVQDEITSEKLKKNVKSIFVKFLQSWTVDLSSKKYPVSMNIDQATNFFHIPYKELFVNNLDYLEYRKLPFPFNIPTLENTEKNNITLLGNTDYKNEVFKFWVKNEDKFRHMYIVWKTWMWKSTMISNMVRSDFVTNKWVAVMDPHGDLVDTLVEHIPSRRTNDVILFDVTDTDYPIWFNILQYQTEEEKNLVISGIVSTFKKLYGDSWGPRLEYILRNVILSLVEYPWATLLHLIRMLKDKEFREEVLEYVNDPIVLKFWREEFDKWNDKFKDEAIAPIVNKVGQFLSSPLVRNIFGQAQSKLNIRQIMDEWKILLINLSKGKIGEDNAAMIWSFLVTKLQIDTMSRAELPASERRDFYFYIDEFQNFATESFEDILSEARKYRLSLIVANQYISQIDEKIKEAIFGNVGTIVTFGLGHDDSQIISDQFKNLITPDDVLSLPKFKAYTKLVIDGISSNPFSMSTFPLPSPLQAEEIKEKIRKQSRQRYWMEKSRLESLIKNRSEKNFSKTAKAVEKAQEKVQQKTEKAEIDYLESIDQIEIGKRYLGVIKLKYNYWVFVVVGNCEWLLHKKKISVPEWVKWKDIYNIWDQIKVKAEETKEVNQEMKVVWSQL